MSEDITSEAEDGDISGYMTKYALSDGIRRVRCRLPRAGRNRGGVLASLTGGGLLWLKVGVDFFTDSVDAEDAARAMAVKRIASLKKQIAKLEKLAVTPKWRSE